MRDKKEIEEKIDEIESDLADYEQLAGFPKDSLEWKLNEKYWKGFIDALKWVLKRE